MTRAIFAVSERRANFRSRIVLGKSARGGSIPPGLLSLLHHHAIQEKGNSRIKRSSVLEIRESTFHRR